MSLILDKLPSTVKIGNCDVAIRTDFRVWILFEVMMMDKKLSDEEKSRKAILLIFPDIRQLTVNEPQQIADALLWFYRCGDRKMNLFQILEQKKSENRTRNGYHSDNQRIYDYDFDDELIYAAFKQQYGLDLTTTKNLHWWKFKALFAGLTEETKLMKIMGYRAAKITGGMTSEQKKQLRKMKEVYALPIPASEMEKEQSMEAALEKGDYEALMQLVSEEK